MGLPVKSYLAATAAVLIFVATAWATITKDTTAGDKNIDGSAGSSTAAFPAMTVAAGDLLVALVSTNQSTNPVLDSVSDGTNTWTQASNCTPSPGVAVWYAQNAASGSTTVTLNKHAAGDTIRAVLTAWAGVATSGALDLTATCASGTSTTPTANSITPSQNNALVIGTCNDNEVASGVSVAGPFTSLTRDANNVNLPAYVIQTTATGAAAAWTISPSTTWRCGANSFLQAATATPTFTPTATATATATPVPTPSCQDTGLSRRKGGLNVSSCGPKL